MKPICLSFKLVIAILCLFVTSNAYAQQGTVFVLRLNEDLIDSFKDFGSLRSSIPEGYQAKISIVEIRFSDLDTDPIDMAGLSLQVKGDYAEIALDEQAINQIRKQPIRVAVPETSQNFSQILLVYNAPSQKVPTTTTPPSPVMNDGGQTEGMYFVRLSSGKILSGLVDELNQVDLSTKFGKVSIPVEQIVGIRFRIDNRDSCVVVLNNGDSITGIPVMNAIELKTDWGQADIEPKYIESLTTTSSARFNQVSTDFGVRWELNTFNSVAPSTPKFK
ncbi:MAG: hypothetical protein AAF939_16150 [Planctomycetota bacterium]